MTHSLEQRIVKMEKDLRFYRFTIAGLLVVAFGFIIMSFGPKKTAPEVIEAKAFHVVDDNGRVLVEINKEDGNGQLSTFSPEGIRLASIFTTSGGAGGLNTFGKDGKLLFKVTNTIDGGGYMALFNGQTVEAAELGVTDAQSGYLKINDRNAKKMAWITYTQDGGGYFSLAKDGLEMLRLSTPGAGGRIGVYNGDNIRIGYLGSQDNKDGNVTIWNAAGTRTGGLP